MLEPREIPSLAPGRPAQWSPCPWDTACGGTGQLWDPGTRMEGSSLRLQRAQAVTLVLDKRAPYGGKTSKWL